jgi:hypothetical protein
MLTYEKRLKNEKEFQYWEDIGDQSRRYWFEITGRYGWKARYVKEVNEKEETVSFYQEIYNDKNELVEIHHKYPVDTGHVKNIRK